MKHAISSIEYLMQMKGFRHGAGGLPIDTAHVDSPEYHKGYMAGRRSRQEYSTALCKEFGLVNPEVHAACGL